MATARPSNTSGDDSGLQRVLGVLSRRWRMIAIITIAIPVVVVNLTARGDAKYQATAQVLLARQNVADAISGSDAQRPVDSQDVDRQARTEISLASNVQPVTAALRRVGVHETARQFLKHASVTVNPNTNILDFSVTAGHPDLAKQLANAWAAEFSTYKRSIDTAPLQQAEATIERRLSSLPSARHSALAERLDSRLQDLRTLETLQISSARVTADATNAPKVAPKPLRNGVLAFIAALCLGVIAAFARDLFDRQLHNSSEVGRALDLPLLGELPSIPRAFRGQPRLVIAEQPDGSYAEAVRQLRSTIELGLDDAIRRSVSAGRADTLDRPTAGPTSVLVTSPRAGAGKTTTVASLAYTLARTGRRVVAVDLDLRRPELHLAFDATNSRGLLDCLSRGLDVDDVLQDLGVVEHGEVVDKRAALRLLAAGKGRAEPSEIFRSAAFGHVLADIREWADVVIMDSAPLLGYADTMTLSAHASRMVIVTAVPSLTRDDARELSDAIDRCHAEPMGFVSVPQGGLRASATHRRASARSAHAPAHAADRRAAAARG